METLRRKLESVGQQHLLSFYEELPKEQQDKLIQDLSDIDWDALDNIYRNEVLTQLDQSGTNLKPACKIEDSLLKKLPDSCIDGTTRCNKDLLSEYERIGCENLQSGKVAALLLAGGQGTRLGVNFPKGMFDVGPPISKSLFQLQAERIIKLKKATKCQKLIWYIMTSESTMQKTRDFFEQNNYFSLVREHVVFFEQGTIPCFGFDGKVLLNQKFELAKSPDGNGGLYAALKKEAILDHMQTNGVEFVHVYCVDNILVRVCDPKFVGYCVSKQVDVGAKVVEKQLPNEAVGTICKVGDQFKVIEYSEISTEISNRRNQETGKLIFNAGNICDHFFNVQILHLMAQDSVKLRYHIAIKKVPHVHLTNGERIVAPKEPNGIKLEKFIFDAFEFSQKFAAWEVIREDEFSPLKNSDASQKDNPTTARDALIGIYNRDLGPSAYLGF